MEPTSISHAYSLYVIVLWVLMFSDDSHLLQKRKRVEMFLKEFVGLDKYVRRPNRDQLKLWALSGNHPKKFGAKVQDLRELIYLHHQGIMWWWKQSKHPKQRLLFRIYTPALLYEVLIIWTYLKLSSRSN
jgi:hypothetical protein